MVLHLNTLYQLLLTVVTVYVLYCMPFYSYVHERWSNVSILAGILLLVA